MTISQRTTSTRGRDFCEGFESLRLDVYKAPEGQDTVGWGHVVRQSDLLKFGDVITRDRAIAFLSHDLYNAETIVKQYAGAELNQNQFDALVSMSMNLGRAPFRNDDGSHTHLAVALEAGNYSLAAAHIKDFDHMGGVKLKGLTRRRQAEYEMFTEPVAEQATDTTNIITPENLV